MRPYRRHLVSMDAAFSLLGGSLRGKAQWWLPYSSRSTQISKILLISFFGITQSITLPKNGHLIEAEEQLPNERLFENICSCEPMNLMVRSERAANERVHQSVLMVRDHDHRNTSCRGPGRCPQHPSIRWKRETADRTSWMARP